MKSGIISLARWLLGSSLAIIFATQLAQGAVFSALFALVLTILLIPPTAKILFQKIKNPIALPVKIAAGITLFFLMIGTAASSKSVEMSPLPSIEPEALNSPEPSPSFQAVVEFTPSPMITPSPTLKPLPSSKILSTPKPSLVSPTLVPTIKQNNNSYSCSGPDLDCPDFSTHAEAQSFFENCGFSQSYDPMRLDSVGVGDGVACESLP